jgi:hypothetical protein
MTIFRSSLLVDALLNAVLSTMMLGPDPARVRVYGGTRPAGGEAPGSAVLVEIVLPDPPGVLEDGTLILDAESTDDTLIANTGGATWARIVNGNGDCVIDCDVSITAGTAELKLSTTGLYEGGLVRLVSGVFS